MTNTPDHQRDTTPTPAGGNAPSDGGPTSKPRHRFRVESLEDRILLSATWADADPDAVAPGGPRGRGPA